MGLAGQGAMMRVQQDNKNISMAYGVNDKEQINQTKETGKHHSVYAGGLSLTRNDGNNPIEQKKQQAKKQAMKVIETASAKEMKIDEDLKSRAKNIEVKQEEMNASQQAINKINMQKQELKESYGITDDSTEAMDLKLLEKRRDIMNGTSNEVLSDEETRNLEEVDAKGLTDYQKQSLDLDSYKEPYQKTIDENNKIVKSETETITAIKLSRLKSHPMLDATKEAEKIEEAASKEAIGMLLDEAKDHIDETLEENVEKAKKEAEENDKLEEKKEAAKENSEELKPSASKENKPVEDSTNTTNQILSLDQIQKQVEKDMKKLTEELQLSSEDMKGISVDTIL